MSEEDMESLPLSDSEKILFGERLAEALTPPTAPPPGVATLTRYLSGALSAAAARKVERGIIAHPATRSVVRQVRVCLNELQSLSWAEVAERARGDDFTAQVAQTRLKILSECVAATPSIAPLRSRGWASIREQVAEGIAEARTAWAAFASFGQQLKAVMRQPRLALARGVEEGQPTMAGELPSSVSIVLTNAEVTNDGALRVNVHVRDAAGNLSDALANQPIHLALVLNDETWEVASTVIETDHADWNVPDVGTALGLPAGQLPAHYLRLTVGEPQAAIRSTTTQMFAEVVDAAGQPTRQNPVLIRFVNAPRWLNEQFTVTVEIPAGVRTDYRNHVLRLDVMTSARSWQNLGAWRLSEWSDSTRTLTAPCPSSPNADASTAFILRARLQA